MTQVGKTGFKPWCGQSKEGGLVLGGGARALSEHCQSIHAQGTDPPNVQEGTYNRLATDSGV